ncbi:hypothetical protein bthur0014_68300 [Bacillus thuringiensis IBL 4222]|jgi:hypothetical protein|nr:hypothetical protein bthur0014_68300 [Bacillus thuringiensis IBL 4222]MED1158310.1 hypothetical protein [Bacillus paranthracis]MED2954928.1 hypothetical protein [Bacillus thuringiensis]
MDFKMKSKYLFLYKQNRSLKQDSYFMTYNGKLVHASEEDWLTY